MVQRHTDSQTRYSPMNAREIQLPLRSDPVPLPRALLYRYVSTTGANPKPDLMYTRQFPVERQDRATIYRSCHSCQGSLGKKTLQLSMEARARRQRRPENTPKKPERRESRASG